MEDREEGESGGGGERKTKGQQRQRVNKAPRASQAK